MQKGKSSTSLESVSVPLGRRHRLEDARIQDLGELGFRV